MEAEYDFTQAETGKFHRPLKVQKTIRLDQDVLEHFQQEAKRLNLGYQTLINQTLRDSMGESSELVNFQQMKDELKKLIRTEMRRGLK